MAELRTDYVDDVLDTSKNTIRKYKQIQNSDGTVSFVDVTEYLTVGTEFGAKDINDITKANNDLNESLTAKVDGFTQDTYAAVTGLAYDATNKKLGLKVGADTVIPFSGGLPDLTTASTRVSSDLVFPNKTDTQSASVAKPGKKVVGVKTITNLSPQTVAYGWSLNTETQVITVTFYNNQVSGAYAYCDVICLYMDV